MIVNCFCCRVLRGCLWIAIGAAFGSGVALSDEPVARADATDVDVNLQLLSIDESLAAVHVRDGFRVELVAAEPLVKDPVAIDWGPDGRLWVAEMADYPMGMGGKGQPGGRIRFLEDTDDDGKYDRSTVFLDGVSFPNGVMAWQDGVLVTAAPDLFYAEDTDNDGLADRREVLFSGFQAGNQQLRVNGLRWGLDNWIYCASGAHHGGYGAGRSIQVVKANSSLEIGSRDFRFHPDTGQIDPQSGPSQFGRDRDDWGNWFGQQNSHPLWHYVLDDHYLRRNPHFAPPDPRRQVVVPANPKVYPASSPQKRFHSFEHSGRFTSACSAMIYRDKLLFTRRDGTEHAFACEPFHNLVQHNVIERDGISFTSHRDPAESKIDFFASEDRWCRPVMVRTGPDGAVWVVDMYRYMIEHPEWLTPEGRAELKPYYRTGEHQGRIYRIVPEDSGAATITRLGSLDTEALVATLARPNGHQRDQASQLLQWQRDESAIEPLRRLAVDSAAPLGRLSALCTLDGMGQLSPAMLRTALGDPHPGVRRHAIRLAEPLAPRHPELLTAMLALVTDGDVQVRLQLACTLGQFSDHDSADALTKLAISDGDDPQFFAAAVSSVHAGNLIDLLSIALDGREDDLAAAWAGQLLTLSVEMENPQATLAGLQIILRDEGATRLQWQFSTVSEVLDAIDRNEPTLEQLFSHAGDEREGIAAQLTQLTHRAREIASDSRSPDNLRVAAIGLLGRTTQHGVEDRKLLAKLLTPQSSPNIQAASVRHLGSLAAPDVGTLLLQDWQRHGPAIRAQILGVLATRGVWLGKLLTAMEDGRVALADVDARTRQTFAAHDDPSIRDRVTKVLRDPGSADRRKVLDSHLPVLQLAGSSDSGRHVFKKRCAACHKMDDVGHDLGPNLRSITDRKPMSLLTAMLDPSAAVDAKFLAYVAVTEDGRAFNGMISSETAGSITLVGQENKQQIILRSELEEIRSTGKSLMPDGLEQEINHQELADLIAYLTSEPPK